MEQWSGWQDLNLQQPAPKVQKQQEKTQETSKSSQGESALSPAFNVLRLRAGQSKRTELATSTNPEKSNQGQPAQSGRLLDAQLAHAMLGMALRGMAARLALTLRTDAEVTS